MKKLTAKDLSSATNDSGLNLTEINKALKDSVDIEYGGLRMTVQRAAVNNTREWWQTISIHEREHVKSSVQRALDEGVKIILNEGAQASKIDCDNFMADLVLWSVINEKN